MMGRPNVENYWKQKFFGRGGIYVVNQDMEWQSKVFAFVRKLEELETKEKKKFYEVAKVLEKCACNMWIKKTHYNKVPYYPHY